MIKLSYSLMGMLLLAIVACNNETEKVTPNGLKYTVIKAGDGVTPKVNDIVLIHFQLKDSKDSVWRNSYKDDMPAPVEIRDTSAMAMEDGITQMFRFLSVGDSVKTTLTVSKFFGELVKRPVPPGIDTTLSITYTFKVKDIMSVDEYRKWSENETIERAKRTKEKDDKTIAKFLADNKIEAKRDTSGIYYTMHSNSGGSKPAPGNCVEVKYEGKLMEDGTTFDKNPKIAFSLNQVIRGWQLAIPMISKGDSATFYIPSQLAYGPQGNYGIPPNSVLIFNVTLFDFKNTFDQATNSCK